MQRKKRLEVFDKLVNNKFKIYNSLFLNLPYTRDSNIGMLVPLLYKVSKDGLAAGKNPEEILNSFFANYANLTTEKEQLDFMFMVIQYVERQVVLYDSVEDAAFKDVQAHGNALTISDFFQKLDKEDNWDKIAEKLTTFSARIVFTAHPTQFYPPAVLDIINKLRTLIPDNKLNEIDLTLQQLGLTSLINSKKPTPFDEAKNIIYFLRHVYYDAIGDLYSAIKEKTRNGDFENPDIIKLGFWPGGDRDGNPFVTPDITKDVANTLRMTLMKCYYNDLKKLQKKLSFREIEDELFVLRTKLYASMFDAKQVLNYKEIITPLLLARKLLIDKYHGLYLNDLEKLIDKVKIFRTHFANLDIRQDNSVHVKTVTSILKSVGVIKENLEELSEEEFQDILLRKDLDATQFSFDESVINDTIQNISQLKSIQQENGEEGCNRYIISNSEDRFAVLMVYGLFRWCGWKAEEISFDIVPLFETMIGMKTAENTMQELFDLPEYRMHLSRRYNAQTIMLGFSDGTKDGGYLKANWSIFKTKETLSMVCDKNNIKAIFFDGRGGPPARGGGKTHSFYASQSKHIANHEIQLTIQGQTITSTYGTKEQFNHNFEQLITAGLSNSFTDNGKEIPPKSRKLLEELGELSFDKYDALKKHKMFIPYLENKSTLKYYGKANIGSRPSKRGNKKELTLSDLRAISFVGSWSQLKQNVPGYFGIGTALKAMVDQGRIQEVKRLFKDAPFFKALILNSMMSLSKCNFDLTSYMKEDKQYKEFWTILFEEYKLSKEMMLLISDFDILMQEEPISRASISIRDEIVLPLLVIQQYALQKISQNVSTKETYEKIVTRSLYGNINASRNSA